MVPMSRGKPELVRLSQLTPGQYADFFALLSERKKSTTRDGKPFFSCHFRDMQRTVTFMAWAHSAWFEACEREWRDGHFYKIRGVYDEHEKYGSQIEIHNIRPVRDEDRSEGFNVADFVEHSRYDPEAMFADLKGLARDNIKDSAVCTLVLTILERHADPIKCLPATTRHAYPFHGGLLEHLLSVTQTCIQLAEKYSAHYPDLEPPINRDLVVAGAILHDIGRVLEFSDDPVKVERTVPGKLVGPIFLGRDLVRDTARELGNVQPDLLQLLEHILVAHLNLLEKDSPRTPLIPECLIVHHADALDSFMEMYTRRLTCDQEPGLFTARDAILGRELYKGRSL
jgi:3'-5' exoribonuclease